MDLVENAVGRMVPTEVNGKKQVPFMGVGKYIPKGFPISVYVSDSFPGPIKNHNESQTTLYSTFDA